ncbi:hypothetical protein BDZ85DRAFT_3339 [Elsinoe ampelina]|uniref:Secreted protein n=1 Tax=Elsinoe ampelina TaxID=302913 RepID=A0A6A6GNV4_9PEZI|nr:hypothetical protein BDZ85DRAFT_3339 [Elsinoe ampelina]
MCRVVRSSTFLFLLISTAFPSSQDCCFRFDKAAEMLTILIFLRYTSNLASWPTRNLISRLQPLPSSLRCPRGPCRRVRWPQVLPDGGQDVNLPSSVKYSIHIFQLSIHACRGIVLY